MVQSSDFENADDSEVREAFPEIAVEDFKQL